MKAKTLILLFVALGCGMIAAVAVSKAVINQGSGSSVEATTEIFVAVKDLDHRDKITADKIRLEKWPNSKLPEGAVIDLALIEGKFAAQTIFAGEPILEKKINDTLGGMAKTLPEGHRIFDIACAASYIQAGDHVDIIGTFRPNGRNAPPETRTVMRNVKVHGINGNPSRDSEEDEKKAPTGLTKAAKFQLLVKESQLEALTLANSLGDLQLHLRPLKEDSKEEDTGRDFLEWIRDEPVEEEPKEEVFTGLRMPAMPTVKKEEPAKSSMVIVTPTGMTTYEWGAKDEMPTEVVEGAEDSGASADVDLPSSNVFSGYGGYPPTYPISTGAPGMPAIPGGPIPAPSGEAVPQSPSNPDR